MYQGRSGFFDQMFLLDLRSIENGDLAAENSSGEVDMDGFVLTFWWLTVEMFLQQRAGQQRVRDALQQATTKLLNLHC